MTMEQSADAYILCPDRNEAETLAAKARRYAQKNGYIVNEIYYRAEDVNSELLERIIGSLSARGIKLLILSDWEALGSDEILRQERRNNIRRTGVRLVFLKAPQIQPRAPRLLNAIKSYNSYSLDWKLRTGAAKPPEQHRFTNGSRLFGYNTVNNRYEINGAEAKLVRLIFDMYISGMGASAISESLKSSGVEHRFPASTIRSMLRNEHYAGMDNGIPGVVPAVVTNRQWLTARGIMMSSGEGERPPYSFIFNNVTFGSNRNTVKLICARSGGHFNYPCYRGTYGNTVITVDSAKLEALLTERIYENLSAAMDAECASVTAFAGAQRERLIQYIADAERSRAALREEFNKTFGPRNRIIRREAMKKFDELKLAFDETGKKLHRAGILLELYSQDKKDICDFFEKAKALPSMHRSEARFFLSALVSVINIEENQVIINCNYNGGERKTITGTSGLIIKSGIKQRTESNPGFTG